VKRIVGTIAVWCVALALTASAQDPALKEQVKKFKNGKRYSVRYDKFDDRTVVAVGPFFLDHELMNPNNNFQMYIGFSFAGGGKPEDVTGYHLLFISNGNRKWSFTDDSTLKAIIDGERLNLGEASHKADVGRRMFGELNLKESLYVSVPADVFGGLAKAKEVEMRLGRKEFTLKGEHLQAFKDLYSLASPASPPAGAPD
jgi:hypothetical protein